MTIVYSIDNVSTDVDDVSVPQLDQATLKLKGTEVNRQEGSFISTYVLPTGDPLHPMTVVVRTSMVPKGGVPGVRRSSITINTWARIVDDGDLLAVEPVSVVLAINTPGIAMEAGDIVGLLGNLYGLSFSSVDAGVPSSDLISTLLFGLTELY